MGNTCYVYVAINNAMPGLVKIGYTKNVKQRMEQLSQPTGVPGKFECYFCRSVEHCQTVEQGLHSIFHAHRDQNDKEFFRIDKEKVKIVLEQLEQSEMPPADPFPPPPSPTPNPRRSLSNGIDRKLQSVGKRTFVKCFDYCAKNMASQGEPNLEWSDIPIYDEESNGNKESSLQSKASTMNRIFKEAQQCNALQICINATKLDSVVIDEARELLEKYCQSK